MISVKAELSNVFAGKTQLKLYKGEGTPISPRDLVLEILPYLNPFDAYDVIYGTSEECVLRSKGEVEIEVDFSGYTDLRDTPNCPDQWLNALEEKCKLVHTEFMRVSSPKSKSVSKDLLTY
jgi:hypothetical protein